MKGKAQGLWLAAKVLDGPAGKSKQDGVHLYIDGRHNREVSVFGTSVFSDEQAGSR